jgi:hypothetical protein
MERLRSVAQCFDEDGNPLNELYEFKHFGTIAEAIPFAFDTAEEAKLFLAKVKVPSPANTVLPK